MLYTLYVFGINKLQDQRQTMLILTWDTGKMQSDLATRSAKRRGIRNLQQGIES